MATEALVRLYDLPPSGPLCAALAATPAARPSAGPRAESFVVIRRGDTVVGRCSVNGNGPGTVGACELSPRVPPADRPRLHWLLVHLALERLRWLGYAYGLVETDEFADHLPAALRDVSWWFPRTTELVSASVRDDKSLEYADMFIDLRTWSPGDEPTRFTAAGRDIWVRRPEGSEHLLVVDWIRDAFGGGWASEMNRSFSHDPISSVIVVDQDTNLAAKDRLLGFVAYDVARLGMLTTIGIAPSIRGADSALIMRTLLEECLREARSSGLPYAVLGGVSHRAGGLRLINSLWTIPGSYPGIFGKGIRN